MCDHYTLSVECEQGVDVVSSIYGVLAIRVKLVCVPLDNLQMMLLLLTFLSKQVDSLIYQIPKFGPPDFRMNSTSLFYYYYFHPPVYKLSN